MKNTSINQYSDNQYQKNIEELKKQILEGGDNESNIRTFKIVEINGKIVDLGHFTIKKKTEKGNPGPGPISAARKALMTITKYLNTNKSKLNVEFMIQEITRGNKQYKITGPYNGYYRKYSPEEIKKRQIKRDDGKIISLKYEPIVKLEKKKSKSKNKKKGG